MPFLFTIDCSLIQIGLLRLCPCDRRSPTSATINEHTAEYKENTKGRGQKKNCEKAVRLTAWVDPPPSPEAVRKMWKILTLTFDFGLWLYMTYNKFYPTNFFLTTDPPLTPLPAGTRKKFGICQNFLTWPYKTTLKMHFSASSQWSKICFGYQGIIFNGKKGLTFSQIVLVSLTAFSQFFFLTPSLRSG